MVWVMYMLGYTDDYPAMQVVRVAEDVVLLARLLYPEMIHDQKRLRADLMKLADKKARR